MDLFKALYDGVEKHGLWFIVQIIGMFITVGLLILAFLYLKKKISDDKKGDVNVTVNLEDHNRREEDETQPGTFSGHEHNWKQLLGHSFFRSVQKMMYYEIQHIEIKERLRRAIFRDFLLIIFTVYHDKIKDFVTIGNICLLYTSPSPRD